jgi:hypothetical protein
MMTCEEVMWMISEFIAHFIAAFQESKHVSRYLDDHVSVSVDDNSSTAHSIANFSLSKFRARCQAVVESLVDN